MDDAEVLSGIKVLVAVAQADGTIHDDERKAIENALDGVELPEGATAATLLASRVDLDAELARITNDEARTRTYEASCAIVFIDGHVSKEERELLDRIAKAFGIEDEGRASRFEKFTSALPEAHLAEPSDVTKIGALVTSEIARAAEFSAVLASSALPIAAESCLFTNNVRLARNIGVLHGSDADEAFWRTFVSNVVGAAASWFAVSTLLKLLPGSGAASAYVTTYALGNATALYFDKDEAVDADALRKAFEQAKKDGQAAAKDAQARVALRRAKFDAAKAPLDADLASGKLSETAYADALVALA
jgi:uncharacterized protein (DUF697 family)/tellurite resistance protein